MYENSNLNYILVYIINSFPIFTNKLFMYRIIVMQPRRWKFMSGDSVIGSVDANLMDAWPINNIKQSLEFTMILHNIDVIMKETGLFYYKLSSKLCTTSSGTLLNHNNY